jgi:hypothetical protein
VGETTESIQARLERIRMILAGDVAAELGELRVHLRWLMGNDGVVQALSETLESNRQLQAQLAGQLGSAARSSPGDVLEPGDADVLERRAAALLGLLEHQRECTVPDPLRRAQVLAVVGWARTYVARCPRCEL